MEKSYSESYAAAGVDITAGYRSVELMKQYVARTMNEHCIGGLGGFGGLFELDCTGYKHPVLISGTDGVGTKLARITSPAAMVSLLRIFSLSTTPTVKPARRLLREHPPQPEKGLLRTHQQGRCPYPGAVPADAEDRQHLRSLQVGAAAGD